ncbi:MAG: DUF177 domain-containing protein [Chloroflexi bacterium]|nr:DUF177 domain-containing protein [Chloroflexota bacterium]
MIDTDRRPDPDPAGALTFNVARLMSEPAGSRRTFPVRGVVLTLADGLRQSGPLEGTIEAIRTERGLFATGRLTGRLWAECSRCLRAIDIPVTVDLEEEVRPSVDIATGLVLPIGTDPEIVRLTDHHELALGGPVRDLLSLAEPIAPLCRPDCPGLCPICGVELATGPHEHPDTEIDPRLAALAAFREASPS